MVLSTVNGVRLAEDAADLRTWLMSLGDAAPPIHEVVVLSCANHGDESPNWSYVEADATAGVARRRCLQCAASVPLLDSEDHWTHPPMWACQGCGQSIAEIAVGLSLSEDDLVRWLAVAVRCVECGRVAGLTDMVVEDVPVAEVVTSL